jgi:hypothetical protein
MFLDLKFFNTVNQAEISAAFFDLHLIYGVLFFDDINETSESAKQLIIQSMRIMNLVNENIEIFTDKKALFERTFVKNAFLKKMR